jgi:hypothetical protein
MSEERITQVPATGNSDRVQTGVTQRQADEESSNPTRLPSPPARAWFYLRLASGAMAAMLFVAVCRVMSYSVYSEPRMLAGPVLLLRYGWPINEMLIPGNLIGAGLMVVLLPSIFAVCVWRNAATITLSIGACICWILIGLWIDGLASV